MRFEVALHRILDEFIPRLPLRPHYNAFELLVATIISQNTNDANVFRAMSRLRKDGVSPERFTSMEIERIAGSIAVAGLQRQKSRTIKAVSRMIVRKYAGKTKRLIDLPDATIRYELMSVVGIGPKTADVFLAFAKGSKVIPIDTHIFRISRRLGISRPGDSYDRVKTKMELLLNPEERALGHLALIQFGREICRAQRPLCKLCRIREMCPSARC